MKNILLTGSAGFIASHLIEELLKDENNYIIGNDNLGTASRIRIFNYIVIYTSCFIVYQNKQLENKKNHSEDN